MSSALISPSQRLKDLPGDQFPQLQGEHYWSWTSDEAFSRMGSSPSGLSSGEAQWRLERFGPNVLRLHRSLGRIQSLVNQLKSPLLWLLLFAAAVSLVTREWADASIVLVIVMASVAIGYSREDAARRTAESLQARVRTHALVLRDSRPANLPTHEIVSGDIIVLSAGCLVPADGIIIEANSFFLNQSVLTGESFPVEKRAGTTDSRAPLAERSNCAFLGSNVRSGTATALVIKTGKSTEFGAIADRLLVRPPETEFDRGVRHFGYLLATTMSILLVVVLVLNTMLGRPPVQSLLFAVALAVGLSPELLPAILSVNLARGAEKLAQHGVLVKRLNAIENLGSMDVLCTDKTGTLTEGIIRLEGAYDPHGQTSSEVLNLGACNAALQTGIVNPLDDAILQSHEPDLAHVKKLAEIPFDFVRKRVSVVIRRSSAIQLITKGAFEQVVGDCVRLANGLPLDAAGRQKLTDQFRGWSSQGIRVLALAVRNMDAQKAYSRTDERDLDFARFLTFLDAPKDDADEAIIDLNRLGVTVKLITGDARLVAQHVASAVGLPTGRVLTGRELDELHDEALWHCAERTDLFVEVDPNQKERIILALKKMGHVVGFLGDGVNDAPAMHAADTSLSVDTATDVAKEAADFVLMERHLDVIRQGVEAGRKTFANTLKYILTTTSANLGNMISMAVASFFLPFLPLLPGQILLNNFLSDIPALGLSGDSVDRELVDRPRRWSIRSIGQFMVEFGLLSSVFDALTFAVLLGIFAASPTLFRTGWFVESLLTELVIALAVRTRRPFYLSRPGSLLLWSTIAIGLFTLALPYLPLASPLGFSPMPPAVIATLVGITCLYVLAVEMAKRAFFRVFD